MKIRAFLAAVAAVGLCAGAYAAPPSELFPSQANPGASGPYGLAALSGAIDLRGPRSGSAQLSLKLPNGRAIVLQRTGFENRAGGNALWQGRAAGHAASQALLTIHQGLAYGRLTFDGEVYEIRPGENGQHIVEQLDTAAFPGCDSGEDQVASGQGMTYPLAQAGTADAVHVVDLLAVYTAAARASRGGSAGVEALIQSAVDTSNAAFAESAMNLRYRLVGTQEVVFDDSGTTSDALSWVTGDAGVAALREQTGADMVSVLVDTPASCGTAWVQRDPGPGFASYAYAATDVDCAVGNLTFAHEHGHNLGMEHNVENSSVGTNPSQASYEFSFAHYVDGAFRTVMSYGSQCAAGCTRVARFSNPDIAYAGEATGVAGQRNNAETGRLTAPIASDFRQSVATDGTVINLRIGQAADDVEESTTSGNVLFDSTDLKLGYDGAVAVAAEQLIGLRFVNVAIPPGATITSAYLEFSVAAPGSTATSAQIRAIDEDSAGAFSAAPHSVSGRATTGQRQWDIVPWSTGELQRSPDIAALVQAIVDRPGWGSGNNLAFTLSASGDRSAHAWDGDAEVAPLLHVEFDTAGGPANIEPSASFTFSTADLTASFSDTSSDADGSLVSRLWDFGDGSTATGTSPVHTYSAAGVYTVSLSVMDDQGASASASQSVAVSEPASSALPAAPSNLQSVLQQSGKGKNRTITGVSLQWSDNSNNESEFVIESCQEVTSGKGKNRTVSCPWSDYVSVSADQTTAAVPTTAGYRYRIRARNSAGSSGYSNEVSI